MAGLRTPATTALSVAGVSFTAHTYEHDPMTSSYGQEAAQALGLDPARVFKTLLVAVDGRLVVAVVPVIGRLDLKALAATIGGKRAELAPPAAAERATGYVVAVSAPIGQRRRLPTVLNASAEQHGHGVRVGRTSRARPDLSPADLVRVTGATIAEIAR